MAKPTQLQISQTLLRVSRIGVAKFFSPLMIGVSVLNWGRPDKVIASGDTPFPLRINDFFSRLLAGPSDDFGGSYLKHWDLLTQIVYFVTFGAVKAPTAQILVLLALWVSVAVLVQVVFQGIDTSCNGGNNAKNQIFVSLFVVELYWLSGTTIQVPYISALLVQLLFARIALKQIHSEKSSVLTGIAIAGLLGATSANPVLLVVVLVSSCIILFTLNQVWSNCHPERTKPANPKYVLHPLVYAAFFSFWWVPWFIWSVRLSPGYSGFSDNSWISKGYNFVSALSFTSSWTYSGTNLNEYWSSGTQSAVVYGRPLIAGSIILMMIGLVANVQINRRKHVWLFVSGIVLTALLSIFPAVPVIRFLVHKLPLVEQALREPSTKVAPLLLVLCLVGFGLAGSRSSNSIANWTKKGSQLLMICSLVAVSPPFMTGEYLGRGSFFDMRVDLSDDYSELINHWKQVSDRSRTILLPISATYEEYIGGFHGADDFAGALGGTVYGRDVGYTDLSREKTLLGVEEKLFQVHLQAAIQTLIDLEIDRVVIRFDQVEKRSKAERLVRSLERSTVFEKVFETRGKVFVVFELTQRSNLGDN